MRNKAANVLVVLILVMSMCLSACAAGETGSTKSEEQNGSGFSDIEFFGERYMARIHSCVDQIQKITDFKPDIAIVLGSGLGHFAENIKVEKVVEYDDIKGFPVTTVKGHKGRLVFGTIGDKKVVAMQGRVHYYEGYSVYDVVLPIRVLHLLGADTVILTNAVGALNADYSVGDFVLIKDHISTFAPSPLRGDNLDELGTRFPDMTNVYDKGLMDLAEDIAKEEKINVHRGVFVQVRGPQYETPSEIKMYRMLGADTIGMSTVVEAIAARHMGMRICGISCITNMAAGMEDKEISHSDVKEQADKVESKFTKLVSELVKQMK